MLFNSYQFVFGFLPAVLVACFLLARFFGPRAGQWCLIGASVIFYGAWNPAYLPLLAGSVIFNYFAAISMVKTESERRRRWLLIGAVTVDLALLGYFKYMNFFLQTVGAVTGQSFPIEHILLPLGISFYTFQQITLLVDISSGAVKNFRFRDFSLFVFFFPHLIAGPIVHHSEVMPQFEKADYRFKWGNISVGAVLFAIGLFKKVVLADSIAQFVSPLYDQANNGEQLTFVFAWGAALGYILQLYFDFSAYSDMALGLARLFGIKLPMNFNSPLKAVSIIDFWSRWHMTLTRFLTAYVYNPISLALTRARMAEGKPVVGGKKTTFVAFAVLVAMPILFTMFLSGLWHGAGMQFIVWGVINGVYLTINHAWNIARPRFWKDHVSHEKVMRPVGFVITFLAVVLAIPFFRADSVASAWNVIGGAFMLHGVSLPEGIAEQFPGVGRALGAMHVEFVKYDYGAFQALWKWSFAMLFIALLTPNALEILRPYDPAITMPAANTKGRIEVTPTLTKWLVWKPSFAWAVATAAVAALGVTNLNHMSEFLYWNF
jgi:alginate O-acetyltransferase complex protein AlgI